MILNASSMKNKWDYSALDQACYSDYKQESYKKAAEFLGDSVEDWGGGTGWAGRYFKNYKNIDGSMSKHTDVHADLADYTSNCDNILIKHVVEYNENWRQIIENAKHSFRHKLCLVILTPEVKKTRIGRYHKVYRNQKIVKGEMIPELYFNRQDIRDVFSDCKLSEEEIKTEQEYGQDWILYVEKV